jgi:histidinol-phosphate aminotransferase
MTDFVVPLRTDLAGVRSYGAPQLDVPVQLNVNENPFPLPDKVAEAMGNAVRDLAPGLHRYPPREAVNLRRDLAAYLRRESGVDLPFEQVWPANGSNEVMHHLFLAFGGPGRTAISFEPTYSMYPEYARDTFTRYLAFPRAEDFSVVVDFAIAQIEDLRPSMVLLASPNNPTGTALPIDDLISIAHSSMRTGTMVIVDEAYAEFRRDAVPSALTLLDRFPNLVVTRTLSKAFGLAGARVGYAVAADPAVVEACRVVRLPYHLSAVTQVVASVALAHADLLQEQVGLLRQERDRLAAWLVEHGFTVVPSDANFILFGRFPDRHQVWQGLLDHGVLIRETGPQEWLRVSIGTESENGRFRDALLSAIGA